MEQNLKNETNPLTKTGFPHKFTKEDSRKGGKASTPRKRMANSLKSIEHGRYSKYSELTIEMAKDPNISTLDVLEYINGIQKVIVNPQAKIQVAHLKLQAHKTIHGEKHKNVNINLDADLKEFYDCFVETK